MHTNYIDFLATSISKPIRLPSLFISFLGRLNRTQLVELEDLLMQKVALNRTPLNVLVLNLFYIQSRLQTQNQNRLSEKVEIFVHELYYLIKDNFALDSQSKNCVDEGLCFLYCDAEYALDVLYKQLNQDIHCSLEGLLSCLTQISFQKQVLYNQKMKGILVDILALLDEMSFEDRKSSMLFAFQSIFNSKIKNNMKGRVVTYILRTNIIDFSKLAHVDLPLARKYIFMPMLQALRHKNGYLDLDALNSSKT